MARRRKRQEESLRISFPCCANNPGTLRKEQRCLPARPTSPPPQAQPGSSSRHQPASGTVTTRGFSAAKPCVWLSRRGPAQPSGLRCSPAGFSPRLQQSHLDAARVGNEKYSRQGVLLPRAPQRGEVFPSPHTAEPLRSEVCLTFSRGPNARRGSHPPRRSPPL